MQIIDIDGKKISEKSRPYVIAEIGANHNGDMALCKKMIDSAISIGASAVKLQSWSPTSLISTEEYRRNTSYSDTKKHFGSLEEMVAKYAVTPEQHKEIKQYCDNAGITFLSSAFSVAEVALLESIDVKMHKVASMDINNVEILVSMAETNKPVILSTGMATLSEIDEAITILEKNHSGPIILLHCVSVYPPEFDIINLRNITMLKQTFGKPVGFSDHTLGSSVALAAIALGAVMIEKHFTLDKNLEGWDHAISANPEEMSQIINEGNKVFSALGDYRRILSQKELEKRASFRRRAVLKRAMKSGEKLTHSDITFKRPGNGISPDEAKYLIGRTLRDDFDYDHEIDWSDLVN